MARFVGWITPVANRAKIAVMSKDVTGYVNGLLTPEFFRGLGWNNT